MRGNVPEGVYQSSRKMRNALLFVNGEGELYWLSATIGNGRFPHSSVSSINTFPSAVELDVTRKRSSTLLVASKTA